MQEGYDTASDNHTVCRFVGTLHYRVVAAIGKRVFNIKVLEIRRKIF
jgi:hypothetical protein